MISFRVAVDFTKLYLLIGSCQQINLNSHRSTNLISATNRCSMIVTGSCFVFHCAFVGSSAIYHLTLMMNNLSNKVQDVVM